MDYCLPLQMTTFGQKKYFHAWVKKCHFGNFSEKQLDSGIGHRSIIIKKEESANSKSPLVAA
jgi:hypothetical protein